MPMCQHLSSTKLPMLIEQVTEWQNRALDSLYPVVYLDCIVVKVRQHSM
ncbi:transposase [Acinetobacter pittii]|nr:transposase [Acinetobacter pittii]